MGAGRDVAGQAERAVRELRGSAGRIARRLLFVGPELLNLAAVPPALMERALTEFDRLSRLLLLDPYWERRIGHMLREARRARRGKPVRVLHVGARTGSLLALIDDWARHHRVSVELYATHADPTMVEVGRRIAEEAGRHIQVSVASPTGLPFEDGAVDVALSIFTLHRLPPSEAAQHLVELDRVAAANYFVFDTRRTIAAVPFLDAMLRLLEVDAPNRRDAMVSLRKGLTPAEARALVRSACLDDARVEVVPPAWLVVTRA